MWKGLRDVQESVLVFVFLVDGAHQGGGGREDLVHEDEDGFFGGKLDAFTDDVDKLSDCEIGGDQIFLLVDGGNI